MFKINHNNLHDLFQVANVKHSTVIDTSNFKTYGWKEKFESWVQQRVKAKTFPIGVDVFSEYEISVGDDKFLIKTQSRGDVGVVVANGLSSTDFIVDEIGTDVVVVSKSISFDKAKFDMQVTEDQLIPLVEVLTPETLFFLADSALRQHKIREEVVNTLHDLLVAW